MKITTKCTNCGWSEILCGSCGARSGLRGWINFSKEELEGMLSNLQQCVSEGSLEYGDDAYNAMLKIQEELDKCSKVNDDF